MNTDNNEFWSIQKSGHLYSMLIRGRSLRTPAGAVITSSKKVLFQRIIADFDGEAPIEERAGIIERPRVHSAYLLASTQIDYVDKGEHPFRSTRRFIVNDPVFNASGDPRVYYYQISVFQSAFDFLRKNGIAHKMVQSFDKTVINALTTVFDRVISGFNNSEISTLINLHSIHGGHFVYPTLLMMSRCSPREYGEAVFAGSPYVVRISGYEPMGAFMSVPSDKDQAGNMEDIEKMIHSYQEDAKIALKFIKAVQSDH